MAVHGWLYNGKEGAHMFLWQEMTLETRLNKIRLMHMKGYAFIFTNTHCVNHWWMAFTLANLETSKSYFTFIAKWNLPLLFYLAQSPTFYSKSYLHICYLFSPFIYFLLLLYSTNNEKNQQIKKWTL